MPIPGTLRFGIQSLDKLIGTSRYRGMEIFGIDLSDPDVGPLGEGHKISSSVCLAGPDGTGKSVFSLHLASYYLADCISEMGPVAEAKGEFPKVLYFSTDLTYSMALRNWHKFALNRPFDRREPLVELREGKPEETSLTINLVQYFPSGDEHPIVDYLERADSPSNQNTGEVAFVDLATRTAGDDWGFVHRLLSTLKTPEVNGPRHLVVLDAVEGFETLVGDLNAFGEKSSRRSRIAQVMRLATGRCHLAFVIEEGRDERLPEEFVTDAVIRLRNVGSGRYLRRTIEIEKTRGQLHVRGQHPLVIRDGRGSTTGTQANPDDPEVRRPDTGTFTSDEIVDARELLPKLSQKPQSWKRKNSLFELLEARKPDALNPESATLAEDLTGLFNQLLTEKQLWDVAQFDRDRAPETQELIDRFEYEKKKLGTPNLEHLLHVNRMLLEDAYPKHLARRLQSYAHVFPSLNRVSREIMNDRFKDRPKEPDNKYAAFGITYLDNMQGGTDEKAETPPKSVYDTRGLPCGTTTALIGDSLTQKSQLGKAFLSRAFQPYARDLNEAIGNSGRQERQKIEEIQLAAIAKGNQEALASYVDEARQRTAKSLNGEYPVALMFTRHDETNENLVTKFWDWNKQQQAPLDVFRNPEPQPVDKIINQALRRLFEEMLKDHIKKHTVCRRFEIHDIPAPILMQIFRSGIEKAQRILLRKKSNESIHGPEEYVQDPWRIRVLIDDLNSFRETFPEMKEDPLMLPSLLFMLVREGVTTLIIDTQTSGSPELPMMERFDSSVRELVKSRIYTWRLPFYGENRVAISLIPPISDEYRGIIRELRWENKTESAASLAAMVDPHFELYMGLERGQPKPIPLEVRLYSETLSFKKYIELEEQFFREVFSPVAPSVDHAEPSVIKGADVAEYNALRDSCHLQPATRKDHTTILQVDEFWLLRPAKPRRTGAFREQWHYLNTCTVELDKENTCKPNLVADPFEVFQPPPAQCSSESPDTIKTKRADLFDRECGYGFGDKAEKNGEDAYLDRVPFTWDFGFLLCNEKAWKEAFHQKLSGPRELSDSKPTVEQVWESLQKVQLGKTAGEIALSQVPRISPGASSIHRDGSIGNWRYFLEAAKRVAEFQSYRTSAPAAAFDFTMLMPESFSCLILEMWCSEVFGSLSRHEKMGHNKIKLDAFRSERGSFNRPRTPRKTLLADLEGDKEHSLEDIIKQRWHGEIHGFSLELYKAWLLLIEVIDCAGLVDSSSHLNFEFKSREVRPQAVASRHWYKTACTFIDSLTPEQLEYNWVPVRLPGHFSVRADWFLAVAGGSRSSRLADRALDLLSSQRANVTRLQMGIGLPTRDLFGSKSRLRTRLVWVPGQPRTDHDGSALSDRGASNLGSQQTGRQKGSCGPDVLRGPLENVEYDDFRRIGAQKDEAEFRWLWRSGIGSYNRHSRIWQKWLNRTLLWWHSLRQRYGSTWEPGFKVYDLLNSIEFAETKEQHDKCLGELEGLDSWKEFDKMRNILIAELQQVSTTNER